MKKLLKYHKLPPNLWPARCVPAESAESGRCILLVMDQTKPCRQQTLNKSFIKH